MSAGTKTGKIGLDLTQGSIFKGLVVFASPIILAGLIQQLYSVVDLIVIGKFMGNEGTVGVSTGGEICDMVTPIATAFATAGMPLNETALAEAWLALGPKIPLVSFGVPSTKEVVDNLYPYVREHNAFLLANHGTLTYGKTMLEALHRMETLEFLAKVLLTSREIGGERSMRAADIDRLRDAHAERLGLK